MMCAGTADFGGMRGEGQRQEVYLHVDHEGELYQDDGRGHASVS